MNKNDKQPDVEKMFTHAAPKARDAFRRDLRERMTAEARKRHVLQQDSKKKKSLWVLMFSTPAVVAVAVLLFVLQFGPESFDGSPTQPLFSQTVSASDIAVTVMSDFTAEKDDIQFATRPNGDMALAYPDGETLTVATYVHERLQWNERAILELDDTSLNPDDISVYALETYWAVQTPTTVYVFDANGEVATTIEQSAVITVVPSKYNDMHVVWDEDGSVRLRYWNDGEWNGKQFSLTSIGTTEMVSAVSVTEKEQPSIYVVGKNASGYLQAALVSHVQDEYTTQFQHTLDLSQSATVVDVDAGQNGEVFVLYQNDGKLLHRRFGANGEMTEAVEVATVSDTAFSAEQVEALYNPYGDGQYIVVWKEQQSGEYTFHHRYWIPRTDWQDAQEFYSTSTDTTLPQMIGFTNGFIQLLWKDHGLFMRQYEPDKRQWTDNRSIVKDYTDFTLYKPYSYEPVRTIQGTRSLVLFEDTNTTQLLLKKWHIGTDPAETLTLEFPEGYDYVYHTSNDNTYYVVMQDGTTLKSFIYQDGQLFQ